MNATFKGTYDKKQVEKFTADMKEFGYDVKCYAANDGNTYVKVNDVNEMEFGRIKFRFALAGMHSMLLGLEGC